MNFWKTKTWKPMDIACLKWSSLLIGAAFGAYFPDFVKENLWVVLVVAVLLAIRPAVAYWKEDS